MSQVLSIMVMQIIAGNVHTVVNQTRIQSLNRTWLHTKIITQMATSPREFLHRQSPESPWFLLEVDETLGYAIKAPGACYAD